MGEAMDVTVTATTASESSQRAVSELVNDTAEAPVPSTPEAAQPATFVPALVPTPALQRDNGFTPTPRIHANGLEQLADLALAMAPMETTPTMNGQNPEMRLRSTDRIVEKYIDRAESPTPSGRTVRTRSSRSAKDDEVNIVETPRALSTPTNGIMSTRRSTRLQHQVLSSPEPEQELEEARPRPNTLHDGGTVEDTVDRDAALAAKLALEEARPPRRLRSTSSRSLRDTPTPSVLEPVRTSSSSRKKPSPLEPPVSPTPPISTPRRPATRSISAAVASTERTARRQSSRLNIHITESPSIRTRASRNDLRVSKRLNGVKSPLPVSKVKSPPKKAVATRASARVRKTASADAANAEDAPEEDEQAVEMEVEAVENVDADTEAAGGADPNVEGDSDVDADGEVVDDEDADGDIDDDSEMVEVDSGRILELPTQTFQYEPHLGPLNGIPVAPRLQKSPPFNSNTGAAAYPTPYSITTAASPVLPNGVHGAVSNFQSHGISSNVNGIDDSVGSISNAHVGSNPTAFDEVGSDMDADGEEWVEGEEYVAPAMSIANL